MPRPPKPATPRPDPKTHRATPPQTPTRPRPRFNPTPLPKKRPPRKRATPATPAPSARRRTCRDAGQSRSHSASRPNASRARAPIRTPLPAHPFRARARRPATASSWSVTAADRCGPTPPTIPLLLQSVTCPRAWPATPSSSPRRQARRAPPASARRVRATRPSASITSRTATRPTSTAAAVRAPPAGSTCIAGQHGLREQRVRRGLAHVRCQSVRRPPPGRQRDRRRLRRRYVYRLWARPALLARPRLYLEQVPSDLAHVRPLTSARK
jgi:hypothetical protein